MRATTQVTVIVLALTFVGQAGCGAGRTGSSAPSTTAAAAESATGASVADPSPFARRVIAPENLRLYLRTGQDLEIDWAVIGAVDQLDGARRRRGTAVDRIGAIGYALKGTGAPANYRAALVAWGETAAYARRALNLADRYRAVADRPKLTEGPLELPVDGQVLAAYGQRYGQLHDGIESLRRRVSRSGRRPTVSSRAPVSAERTVSTPACFTASGAGPAASAS